MDRSLLSAVSGIDANQTWLDVIGNNIANANTTGFKQDNITFDALLSQEISGATAPNGVGLGGVNGVEVGTGVETAAITPDQSEGSLQQTGNPTDVAINGNGFLAVNNQGSIAYTRDGTMSFDANGNLVTPTGGLIQGWQANAAGVINTSAPIGKVQIPVGLAIAPLNTANVNLGGNLPAGAAAGTVETSTVNVYDTQGNAIPLTITYTMTATPDQWSVSATTEKATGGTQTLLAGTLTFAGTGQLTNIALTTGTPAAATPGVNGVIVTTTAAPADAVAGATFNGFNINFPATALGQNNVTQYAGADSIQALSQDGYASGSLASITVGQTGIVTGGFTNGQSLSLGQVALATFSNPSGLNQIGQNYWGATPNSGLALINTPGSGGAGTLTGGALEASNVQMSTQLTNLIVAQTSYQANTRVVTTNATVLNSLIQMA